MSSGLKQWLCERWPFAPIARVAIEEEIVGGDSYFYALGSATLIAFVLQLVTGMWQMFYYVPTVDHAYDSLNFLRTSVALGWLLHGMHYWGASAMLVLLVLHMVRVYVWGAYKRPRELTWLLGVVLLLLTLGMSFTGVPLPWDERGYWAAQVVTNASATVPLFGDVVRRLILGGASMSQLTLARFFMMHVAILPTLLAAFIVAHIIALRQFGSVGPWNDVKRRSSKPFWPNQVFKDAVVGLLVFAVVLLLAAYIFPPFTGPADPTDVTYIPKPEWNFLFFYQALKYFKGGLEPVGTLGLPIIGVLIMVLIPFIDRRPERNPLKRPLAMGFMLVSAAILMWLTIAGYESAPSAAASPASPEVAGPVQQANISPGAKVFAENSCAACHKINGTGGSVGPDLSNEAEKHRTNGWLATQIRNPKAHNPNSIMPAFAGISKTDLNNLIDYLQSLGARGKKPQESSAAGPTPPAQQSNISHGQQVYSANNCSACHKINGVGGTIGPDLSNEAERHRTDDWLTTQIRNPKAHDPDTIMPAFSKMNSNDLNDLVAYLQSLGAKAAPGTPQPAPPTTSENITKGAQVFAANNCSACHKVNGVGGSIGPDLSNEAERHRTNDWLMTQIRNPKVHNPNSIMPAFAGMNNEDLSNLIDYLQSLGAKGAAPAAPAAPPSVQPSPPKTTGVRPAPTRAPVTPPTGITPRSTAKRPAAPKVPRGVPSARTSNIKHGAQVFASHNCAICHRINGVGGTIGPDLSDEAGRNRTRNWLAVQIRNPKSHNPGTAMPAFGGMSDKDLNVLIDYLQSLGTAETSPPAPAPATTQPAIVPTPPERKTVPTAAVGQPKQPGEAAFHIGSASHGDVLYQMNCQSCHGIQGKGGVPNPGSTEGVVPPLNPIRRILFNTNPQTFAENIDVVTQYGSIPAGPHPAVIMPDYGTTNTLTQAEIADIEAYVMGLNGVNRAKLLHPGILPHQFVLMTFILLGVGVFGLGVTYALLRHR